MAPVSPLRRPFAAAVLGAAVLSSLGLSSLGAAGPAGAFPDDYAPLPPPPPVVATLEMSCTEAVPVPTITATVTNNAGGAPLTIVRRNGLSVGAFPAPAGQTAKVYTSPHWEDVTSTFEVEVGGEVLVSVDHHVDCLHPILEVALDPSCDDGTVGVSVHNSGAEGTHVVVRRDGAVVAEPPVAPGATAEVAVPAAAGQVVSVHHHGELIAETEAGPECAAQPARLDRIRKDVALGASR